MSKFKVGDIVRGISSKYSVTNYNMTEGRVMSICSNGIIDVRVLKHNDNRGIGDIFPVSEEYFELVEPYQDWKVLIVPRGDKTVAKLYKSNAVVKTVECNKHPDDEYSMDEAIKVVTERLREPEKPNYYNGKVVCTEVNCPAKDWFTLGKIYQVENGFFKLDNGLKFPVSSFPIRSFKDLQDRNSCKWLEVVE